MSGLIFKSNSVDNELNRRASVDEEREDSNPSANNSGRSSRLKSFAFVEGQEGKPVTKDQYVGQSLAVVTSGGDAQGRHLFEIRLSDKFKTQKTHKFKE